MLPDCGAANAVLSLGAVCFFASVALVYKLPRANE